MVEVKGQAKVQDQAQSQDQAHISGCFEFEAPHEGFWGL
jgi:hypothetical protein